MCKYEIRKLIYLINLILRNKKKYILMICKNNKAWFEFYFNLFE